MKIALITSGKAIAPRLRINGAMADWLSSKGTEALEEGLCLKRGNRKLNYPKRPAGICIAFRI
jgi:hypothetical protein